MPLYKEIYTNQKWRIAIWKITETIEELSSLVDDATMLSYANEHFAGVKRRSEWLATRLLVKELLGHGAQIEYDDAGKPFIVGIPSLSISHTDGYVAVILSYDSPVGIDIERRNRNMGVTYRRFMNEQERAGLREKNRNDMMLVHWTAKEALFKITGNLGGSFKENITLSHFEFCEKGVVSLSLSGVEYPCSIFRVEFVVTEDFVLSICSPVGLI